MPLWLISTQMWFHLVKHLGEKPPEKDQNVAFEVLEMDDILFNFTVILCEFDMANQGFSMSSHLPFREQLVLYSSAASFHRYQVP